MNIFYEKPDSIFSLNFEKKKRKFNKVILNKWVGSLNNKDLSDKQDNIFLLDEARFSFFSIDNFEKDCNKLTIKLLNNIVHEKNNQIQADHWGSNKFLYYFVDNVYVNWEKVDYLIRQSGNIYFRLNFIYLEKDSYYIFSKIWWTEVLNYKRIFLYPQSVYTIWFLKKTLERLTINLLYINDEDIKLVKVKEWFYKEIHKFKLWKDKLKHIFQENDILSLYHDSFQTHQFNDFAKKLISESIYFYWDMLCRWMKDFVSDWESVILISELSRNKFFLEVFTWLYNKYINWYILPFNHSRNLDDYGKKRLYNEIDVLTYINSV